MLFEEVDDIIFCTGYSFDFSSIDGGDAIPVSDNQVDQVPLIPYYYNTCAINLSEM
jgi:hypothetical protein